MTEKPKRRTLLQTIGIASVGYSFVGTEATSASATGNNPPPHVSKTDAFDSSIVVSNSDKEHRSVTVQIVAKDNNRRVFSRSYQLNSKGNGKGIPAPEMQGVVQEPVNLELGDELHYTVMAKMNNGQSTSSDVVVPSAELPRNRLIHVRIRDGKPSISVSKT